MAVIHVNNLKIPMVITMMLTENIFTVQTLKKIAVSKSTVAKLIMHCQIENILVASLIISSGLRCLIYSNVHQ